MNATLFKALLALVAVSILFYRSAVFVSRQKGAASLIQLLGAGCLILVVLTHICEALHLFPSMHWGAGNSVGHYLDFWSAVFGVILFASGYLLRTFVKNRK